LKRPIVVICLGYIIGILWGLYCKSSIALLYIGIISIIITFKIISKRKSKKLKIMSFKRHIKYIKLIIKFSTIITIIVSSLASYLVVRNLNDKYNNLYKNIDDVKIVAVVIDNGIQKEYKNVYKIKVELLNNSTKHKNTKLLLNTNKNVKLEYGDKVIIQGKFKEPSIQRNYKGFNYKEYLKTQKVYGSVTANNIKVTEKECNNYLFTISNKVNLQIKKNIDNTFSEEIGNVFVGIMLGDTDEIDEDIKENFKLSNMSHILAVSGMHIAYIIIGLNYIMKDLLGKRKTNIVIIIILIFYMFITNFSVSVVRASIMAILVLISKIIYRKNDIWVSICFSALILLIYNPFYITSAGMLLTYGGTIGIIILKKNISKILKIKKKENLVNLKDKIINYIKEIIGVSISAQIIIFQIIIMYFNTINLSFLITCILLGNVIGIIVVIGFVYIVIGLFRIEILKILVFLIEPLIKFTELISKIGAKLPLNQIYVVTPSIVHIILYYIIIFILNYLYKIYSNRKHNTFEKRIKNYISLFKFLFNQNKKKIILIILILSLIVCFLKIIPSNLKIYFVDVGQGDCTLIVTPQNKKILIDGGGSTNYDVGENTLLPYLLDRKITKLDYIFISHFDQDHVGRSSYIIKRTKCRKYNNWKTI